MRNRGCGSLRTTALGALAGLVACANAHGATLAHFEARMNQAQEVPTPNPALPDAAGRALITLDTDTDTLSWHIEWEGVGSPEIGLHFHGPAAPGATAAAVVNVGSISGLGSASIGSTVLTPTQTAEVLAGQWYVNLHTIANVGGEIRGQVVAAAPRIIGHQGFLTDDAGAPRDGLHTMTFRLYDETGGQLWVETQSVAVSQGLFVVELGAVSALNLDFSRRYFLGIQVEGDPEMSPRLALASAPYALRAKSVEEDADVLGGLACASGEVARWSGTAWACDAGDALGSLSCASGEVAKWGGAAWTCEPDVDTDSLAALSCGPGEVAKWGGEAWTCAPDVDTDTDTDTLAGLACGSDQVAKWTGAAWACAPDEDTKTAAACAPGTVLERIEADGTVACRALISEQTAAALDTAGGTAAYTSVAIGSDGLAVVGYVASGGGEIRVLHCGDLACTPGAATVHTVDPAGGLFTSIAIGANGFPVLSYYAGQFRFARCGDVSCSPGLVTIGVIDFTGGAGQHGSVAIGADDNPVFSYNGGAQGLKVARCGDSVCTPGGVTIFTLDFGSTTGLHTSIAIGADGYPVVSYFSQLADALKVVHCGDAQCFPPLATVQTLDPSQGLHTSIAIGSDGLPVVSYGGAQIRVAHCGDVACTPGLATISTIDAAGGIDTSIAIGDDGFPVVSYHATSGADLRVVRCGDLACTPGAASVATVDSAGSVGLFTSIAVGQDGFPVVSYLDQTNGVVKVAHCVDPGCSGTPAITLGGLSCGAGEVPRWGGSAWTCGPNVDTGTLAGLSCAGGQIPKWSGSAWACQSDDDTDTLGSLSCGPGEVAKWGGEAWTCQPDADTDTDTDTLASLSCGAGEIAKWDGGAWACQSDADTIPAGACAPGSFVASVDAGGVVCRPLGVPVPQTTFAADGAAVMSSGSIAIGADGLPVIAYLDQSSGNVLRVMRCGDVACSPGSASVEVLDDTQGSVTTFGIALGSDALPVIAYYHQSDDVIRLAHCGDATCTPGLVTFSDLFPNARYPAIAIGTDGFPIVSYQTTSSRDLRITHCGDLTCSAGLATDRLIDSSGTTGWYSSIAIGNDGLPVISYGNSSDDELRVAHCGNVTCGSRTIRVLATSVGSFVERTSIAIGADGFPIVVWPESTPVDDLRVVHCGDVTCDPAQATLHLLDGVDNVGDYASIAIGTDGLPIISYYDASNTALKVAHCGEATCDPASATFTLVDDDGSSGTRSSIAIGGDGLPVIAYRGDGTRLEVAHCSNPACTGSPSTLSLTMENASGTTGPVTATCPAGTTILFGFKQQISDDIAGTCVGDGTFTSNNGVCAAGDTECATLACDTNGVDEQRVFLVCTP